MHHKLAVIVVGLGSFLLLFGLTYLLFALPTPSVAQREATDLATTTMKNVLKAVNATEPNKAAVIAKWYTPLTSVTLGNLTLQASIADTEAEREQGLSGTPYLPNGIVKLFVFDTPATWAFWMKDMQYPIDIIWLDAGKTVIHIEHSATPESYPNSFAPTTDALYVIETPAGFATESHLEKGAKASW